MGSKVLTAIEKSEVKQAELTYKELMASAMKMQEEMDKALDEAKIARAHWKRLLCFGEAREEATQHRNRARSLEKQAKYLKGQVQQLMQDAKQAKELLEWSGTLPLTATQKRKVALQSKIFQAQENIARWQKAIRQLEQEEEALEQEANHLENMMDNYKANLQPATQSKQERSKDRVGNYPLNTLWQ